jgi:UDP-glucose 4-epimerase
MTRVLVAGGAGYIGSHMVKALAESGHAVVTLDDFSTGGRAELPGETLVRGSIGDARLVAGVLKRGRFDAVMHFAARSVVVESARDPAPYWANNVAATLVLLDAMRRHGPARLVFSSSAAVYGDPGSAPVAESHPCAPVNPYGRTKLAIEHALGDYGAAYGLRFTALRYFNAAGADPDGRLAEHHDPETHLIPIVLQSAAGLRGPVSMFGDDYPTHDGSCVRDYVHVCDLCAAHLLALERLLSGGASATYNLGNSRAYSVREVIDTAGAVTGTRIRTLPAPRRPGDPAVLVSDSSRARRELGWRPRYERLADIVATAWRAGARERRVPVRGKPLDAEARQRGAPRL